MGLQQKNILVAPLNWGLGHATRCIPIIKALEQNGFTPIIASDGMALQLLQIEFPQCTFLELPSYKIKYPKKGAHFRWKILLGIPNMVKAIAQERKCVEKWISQYQLSGIISDNRLGVFSSNIPSIFITHQLNVLTGFTTYFSTKIHQKYIYKFTECWVPDVDKTPNLSGKLGHLGDSDLNVKYIGILSRFRKKNAPIKHDLLVLLSGPEPQRTLLEEKLIIELKNYKGKVLFIKGILENEQKIYQKEHILFYNFMESNELEQAFAESDKILCRSGYTTIMDLSRLEKKAFFIPTPGQFEQHYLAEKFQQEKFARFCLQNDFTVEKLAQIENYNGIPHFTEEANWEKLFSIFERK